MTRTNVEPMLNQCWNNFEECERERRGYSYG